MQSQQKTKHFSCRHRPLLQLPRQLERLTPFGLYSVECQATKLFYSLFLGPHLSSGWYTHCLMKPREVFGTACLAVNGTGFVVGASRSGRGLVRAGAVSVCLSPQQAKWTLPAAAAAAAGGGLDQTINQYRRLLLLRCLFIHSQTIDQISSHLIWWSAKNGRHDGATCDQQQRAHKDFSFYFFFLADER